MRLLQIAFLAVIGLALVSVAGSTRPAEAAAKCPRIFMPVCAVAKTGERKTFNNTCLARVARARFLHNGECGVGEFCPFIFLPVCALDPATRRPTTYSNACLAEKANARLLYNEPCK